MIAVLDYGIGNLASAEKALRAVGGDARLVTDRAEAKGASGVVLPGVGAFGACADALRTSGLDEVARQAFFEEVPFLGICVGFQLLFASSEESPQHKGLGLLPGEVRRLHGKEKLPHMQWNTVTPGRNSAMFAGESAPLWFYFVHSYAPVIEARSGLSIATADYDGELVAAVDSERCWGVQFHPEKSARDGLSLLERFVERCAQTERS